MTKYGPYRPLYWPGWSQDMAIYWPGYSSHMDYLKASPLPPAPWKLLTCCIEIYWFEESWDIIFEYFGVLGDHFDINLVIIWCQVSLRRALECPIVDLYRFFMNFGCHLGIIVGSLFHILCDLRHQKTCLDCRHDSWWFVIGKSADFWCPNLSKAL